MFGKGKKKLDRKMRRRIRKTSAVMLLISAITVAAIPVPEAAAANGDDGIVAYADPNPDNEAVPDDKKVSHSVRAKDDVTTQDKFGTGIIPWISSTGDESVIFTDDSGLFKFAHVDLTGTTYESTLTGATGTREQRPSGYKAVLLDCGTVG